jgi:AraC family cel operon transcriptional repressor
MEFAAGELRTTLRPIIEIALECGISNLSHFYGLFKTAHGTTPRAYRLRHLRTID